jgi:hypothetical protein
MRDCPKILEEQYLLIAEKYGITLKDVFEIESAIWRFVRDSMTVGGDSIESFENIYLRNLGTFHISSGVYKHINKHKDVENTGDI